MKQDVVLHGAGVVLLVAPAPVIAQLNQDRATGKSAMLTVLPIASKIVQALIHCCKSRAAYGVD